jgi:hypothetical protein
MVIFTYQHVVGSTRHRKFLYTKVLFKQLGKVQHNFGEDSERTIHKSFARESKGVLCCLMEERYNEQTSRKAAPLGLVSKTGTDRTDSSSNDSCTSGANEIGNALVSTFIRNRFEEMVNVRGTRW